MNVRKILKRTILAAVLCAAVAGGGVAGVKYIRKTNNRNVEVTRVSDLNGAEWISWGEDSSSQGTVVSNVSQKVRVPDDKVINKVYVQEGDKVKVGDKLLSYDTTLLELDKELQELTVIELGLELKAANADLNKLYNTTPVARKSSNYDTSDDDDDDAYYDDDDDDMYLDEARLLDNDRMMLAESAEAVLVPVMTGSAEEPSSEKDTEKDTEEDTTEKSTEASTDETEEEELMVIDRKEADVSEEQAGEEIIFDGEEMTVLSADELMSGTSQEELSADLEALIRNDGAERRIYQSVDKLLKNILILSVDGEEETVLADTAKDEEPSVKAEGSLKLIPHFRETAEAHFNENDTYKMLIQGLTLREDLCGQIFGTAKEEEDTYTEIGGFTLVQTEGIDDLVQMTLAFHGGLAEQHESCPELWDTYLEIPLTGDEVHAGNLYFMPSDSADDTILVAAEKEEAADVPEEMPETEAHIDAGEGSGEETGEGADTDLIPETEELSDTEIIPEQDEEEYVVYDEADAMYLLAEEGDPSSVQTEQSEQIAGNESESTSEEASETESEPEEEVGPEQNSPEKRTISFDVIWHHGTNHPYYWPSSLKVCFKKDDDDDSEIFLTDLIRSVSEADEDPQDGGNAGGDEIESEVTDAAAAAAAAAAGNGTGDETGDEDGDGNDTVLPETEAQASAPSETLDDTDDTMKKDVTWAAIMTEAPRYFTDGSEISYLTKDPSMDNSYGYWWAYAPNYRPEFQVEYDEGSGAYHCVVIMTYIEPTVSPLLKLNPVSELNYAAGINTEDNTEKGDYSLYPCAYKGDGTAEDPYVFFVKDGVKITSGFVNWVMGFNEDGTERLHEGYYVRLEIREADAITGAFIRSIDIDGTVMAETGVPPTTYWIFDSLSGMQKHDEELPDDVEEPSSGGGGMWSDDDGTYTAEELAAAIKEKELEIKKLELDEREAKLKLKKYEKQLKESEVLSAVNGVVKSISGSMEDAYMIVGSENGLYVQTTVSELDLDNVQTGQEISCQSWDSGNTFRAKITQIDYYPKSSSDYYFYYSSNPNSSNYPVLAVIEDNDIGVEEYESLTVQFPSLGSSSGDIYIEKAYIRAENGQSYVFKSEAGKLVKQFVRTGKNSYGYIEIKRGLTEDDMIAFPYGKNVKEGAAAVSEYDED